MKLYQILIGVVIIGLISTGFYNFISSGVDTMSDPTSAGFDGATLQGFDENANNIAAYNDFLNNQTASADTDNRNDILGAIFARGYQQARSNATTSNLNRYNSLISDGIGEIGILGPFGDNLALAISSVFLIAVGVGIFLYFIIGKERV